MRLRCSLDFLPETLAATIRSWHCLLEVDQATSWQEVAAERAQFVFVLIQDLDETRAVLSQVNKECLVIPVLSERSDSAGEEPLHIDFPVNLESLSNLDRQLVAHLGDSASIRPPTPAFSDKLRAACVLHNKYSETFLRLTTPGLNYILHPFSRRAWPEAVSYNWQDYSLEITDDTSLLVPPIIMDEVLWKVGAVSGELLFDPGKEPIGLRQWPLFSLIASNDQQSTLAAKLLRRPASYEDLQQQFDLQELSMFLNGCRILDLLEVNQPIKVMESAPVATKQRSGVLSMLKRAFKFK